MRGSVLYIPCQFRLCVFFMSRLFRHWEIPTWKASFMGPNGLILTILISRFYRLWNYFSLVLPLYYLSVQTLFDHPLSPGECVQCTLFIIKSCALFFFFMERKCLIGTVFTLKKGREGKLLSFCLGSIDTNSALVILNVNLFAMNERLMLSKSLSRED